MTTKMNKKMIIAGVIVLVALAVGGVFAYMHLTQKKDTTLQTQQKKKITDPVNVVDQSQRPFMEIKPLDEHNIAIAVNQVKKPATSMDYELEYQTDSSLQGLTGVIDLTTLPSQTKPILLGT